MASTPQNPNLAPPPSVDEVAFALIAEGEDPTAERVAHVHAIVSQAELPRRLDRTETLSALVSVARSSESVSLRLGEDEARRLQNSTYVRALTSARIYELPEAVRLVGKFAGDATVTDGVVTWNSNGQVPPQDILDLWSFLDKPFDPRKSTAMREEMTDRFLAEYRAVNTGRAPSAGELGEMRAAFGPEARPMNVITGDRYDLRVSPRAAAEPTSLNELIAQALRKKAQREALADELVRGKGADESIGFERADGMTALAGPDASKPGAWRVTWFDANVPFAHAEVATLRDAVVRALKDGYSPTVAENTSALEL